jgi:putative transcriptional regulator
LESGRYGKLEGLFDGSEGPFHSCGKLASEPGEVTGENFGDLLKGLEEAVAVDEGRLKRARVSRRKITARKIDVPPPPEYSRARIQRARTDLGVSQAVFASLLNVSKGTVSAWEQAVREPEGPTRRLLEVAATRPAVFIRTGGGTPPHGLLTAHHHPSPSWNFD